MGPTTYQIPMGKKIAGVESREISLLLLLLNVGVFARAVKSVNTVRL